MSGNVAVATTGSVIGKICGNASRAMFGRAQQNHLDTRVRAILFLAHDALTV